MPLLMGDTRSLDAIARIERALARIEASARKSGGQGPESAELAHLRNAHHALRARVEGAIYQIDRLLESEGG
jgi:hypothetical protein